MSKNIIDTHTHFFDPTRSEGVPWPPADNEILYRPTYPKDFLEVSSPHGVTGTVVVEASVWLEDNQWILDLAESNPVIVGFVGNVELFADGFSDRIEGFSSNPIFRGIRLRRDELRPEMRPKLIGALRELASRRLSIDLLAQPDELATVASIADAVPDLHIMLDHVAHVKIDGNKPDQRWIDGIIACGKRDGIYCKVSGLVEASVTRPAPVDRSFYRPTIDALVDSFGIDRLSYGSNWPVCRTAGDYSTVFAIPREYFLGLGETEADKVFRKNALDCYRCVESRAKSR